jgi:N-acetylglucosamine kinase-like BadF-type ATPase
LYMKFVGIDGGGTKTIGVVTDETGKVMVSHTVGGTNPNGVGIDQVKKELATLVRYLLDKVDLTELAGCFAGMSGIDHPTRRAEVGGWLRELLPGVPVEIDIDPVNALYSGSKNGTGVVFISGTGSICFSLNAQGERIRVGGWGYLLGDEGSGFDFGRRTLEAVMKGFDGRIERPPLFTAYVLEYFRCESSQDLIPLIYEPGMEKSKISAVAPLLFKAFEEGDPTAKQIVDDVMEEVLLLIQTALNRLDQTNGEMNQVVLVGSVFQKQKLLVSMMKSRLEEAGYTAEWNVPEVPPVAGAAAKAIVNKLGKIPSDFDTQFNKSFLN